MLNHLRTLYHRHQPLLAIFALFFSFRLLALLLFRPGGFIADFSDYQYYFAWGELLPQGYRMYENLWSPYPPLFGTLMLPTFDLASRIPPWIEPQLFFHLIFGLELLLFECGNFVLIYRLGQKLEGRRGGAIAPTSLPPYVLSSSHPVVLYALLFVPVYTLLGHFEAMPLFFLLLGLDLLLSRGRWGWIGSAVAAALGFLTKLTPAVLVPVGVRWLGGKLSWPALRDEWFNPQSPGNLLRPMLYGLTFALVVAGLGYVLVQGNLTLGLSSLRVNAIRSPWQSVWALFEGYYGFGLVPIDIRNLPGLEKSYWESSLPWAWLSAAFVALYLWVYTRHYDWTQPRTPIALTAIGLVWLLLYSKGWSPQFLVMVLPFVVLLSPNLYGVAMSTMLSLLNIVESVIYFVIFPQEHWLLAATVWLRTALLVLLIIEWLGQIWPTTQTGVRLRTIGAGLAWGVMVACVVGGVVAWPRAVQAYGERRLAEHPCRPAIDYLRSQPEQPAALLISDQIGVWHDFYPWLRDQYELRIIDGYNPQDHPWPEVIDERLDAFVGQREFWWVERPQPPSQAGRYFARPDVAILERQQLGDCTVARAIRLAGEPLGRAEVAGGTITLRHAAFEAAQVGANFHLVLYWRADAKMVESYTVFTHLLDEGGQLVAQQDNLPVNGLAPTNTWQLGITIRDPYQLTIPASAAPGRYRLLVGLYNDRGRLAWTLPDGTKADAVPFEVDVITLGD